MSDEKVDFVKIQIAREHGIKMAHIAATAAEATGLAYAACCALLMQETSGGVNRYGHDETQFDGFNDLVDKSNYRAYKWQRDHGGHRGPMGAQGVGPVQITSRDIQNEADALHPPDGGCESVNSMIAGFRVLKRARDAGKGWVATFQSYNPGSPGYGEEVEARREHWQKLLNS